MSDDERISYWRDGIQWYNGVLSDRKNSVCEDCGLHDGDLHPFTRRPVYLKLWHDKFWVPHEEITFRICCLDCWRLATNKKPKQGMLI